MEKRKGTELEMIAGAYEHRRIAFQKLAKRFHLSEEEVGVMAGVCKRSNMVYGAIEAAREFGAAGFAYTYFQQTRATVPVIARTLESLSEYRRVN